MNTNPDLWRMLKVGDRVRMVELPTPSGTFREWPLHADTRRAYRYLLRRTTPLVVCEIDEYGCPWVQFRLRGRNGRMEHHSMMLNHGGLRIVARRNP
jgi:hypothetical protein